MAENSSEGQGQGINLASRKFLLSVMGIGACIYMYSTGALLPEETMKNIIILIGMFVIGEGFVDASRVFGGAAFSPDKLNGILKVLIPAVSNAIKNPAEEGEGE